MYAQDQKNQLQDYYQYAKDQGYNEENIYVLYLTLDGHKASEYSLGDLDEKLVTNISYKKHVLTWLKSAYQDLKYENNENILKSALEQYIISIKNLTGENRDQTQQKIIEFITESNLEIKDIIESKQLPDELVKIFPILKCIHVHKIFGGSYISADMYKIEELKKTDIEEFKNRIPYFTGVLFENKNLIIIFLDDGHNQYQIHTVKRENDTIILYERKEQEWDLSYIEKLKVFLK